jgi:putative oxidoreductase
MNGTCESLTALFGRIFLSAIFLMSGFAKITDWSGTAAHMDKEGMTAIPVFLAGAILLEIGGGLLILLGLWTRLGAAALIVFLVPATLIFHDFWTFEGQQRQQQMIQFMKNLALMGGLLMVAALGPGGYSFDHRWKARQTRTVSEPTDQRVLVG